MLERAALALRARRFVEAEQLAAEVLRTNRTDTAAASMLAQALLAPTRIYVTVLPHLKAGRIKGLAHITGGGLIENPPRAIAEGLVARFDWNAWALPPVFAWMQAVGGVSDHELRRTFNCGVGLMLIVDPAELPEVLEGLVRAGEDAFVMGELAAV